jgi:DNA-binding NarL/FixJ family response regulator
VPLRVVLAEDNLLVREGVQRLLEAQSDVDLVATCGDLDALLAAVERERPDVVITDIRMPPTGTDEGIRAAERLRTTHPEIGVLVLSQHDDPEYALALLEGGSAGRAYLLKERVSNPDQLLGAVREVAQGGSVIDPKVVEALIAQRARAAHSPLADLTPREREVLAGMAEGKTNAAIAQALVLTPRAVEKHINVIFSKLPMDQHPAVDRRVTAVLLFLAETA